jgi:hypothetical protein
MAAAGCRGWTQGGFIMKRFYKLLGRKAYWLYAIAIGAVIGFSMAGCKLDNDDYEKLNGVWDRGDIVVTFTDSNGVFTEIRSGSGWKPFLDNGTISIGHQKFRNISKSGDLEWMGQELTYYTDYSGLGGWEDCTITMAADGRSIQVNSSSGTNTYTKK